MTCKILLIYSHKNSMHFTIVSCMFFFFFSTETLKIFYMKLIYMFWKYVLSAFLDKDTTRNYQITNRDPYGFQDKKLLGQRANRPYLARFTHSRVLTIQNLEVAISIDIKVKFRRIVKTIGLKQEFEIFLQNSNHSIFNIYSWKWVMNVWALTCLLLLFF